MTVIVGIVGPDGKITMGGGSVGVNSRHELDLGTTPKVFKSRKEEMLIGVAGSWLVRDLLEMCEYKLEDIRATCIPDLRYQVRAWVDYALSYPSPIFKEVGKEDWVILVGVRGRLFKMWKDRHITEALDKFDACGVGEPWAKGALAGMQCIPERGKFPLKSQVLWALNVAQRYCSEVRGPFITEEL